MRIFLSYSSPDRPVAEEIQLALLGAGHEVFFDQDSLPAGGNYHSRISLGIKQSDAMVFVISPSSVAQGSYALTELKFARAKWRHPQGRVLPVRLSSTPWKDIPAYLRSVTVLEPDGNLAAEVVAALSEFSQQETDTVRQAAGAKSPEVDSSSGQTEGRFKHQIWVAVLGLVATLGAAVIANWGSLPFAKQAPALTSTPNLSVGGLKGPDASAGNSPALNEHCPEVTFIDYSKVPPQSMIVRRCDP